MVKIKIKRKDRLVVPIRISVALRVKLKELGKKGDTYEDVIWRLMRGDGE